MTEVDVKTTSIKPSMASCACGDCGCNSNSKYHDCKVADRIFKQLSPDIVNKLGSTKEYDTLLSYRSFENGSITIELMIKPIRRETVEHACHDKDCAGSIKKTVEVSKVVKSACCKHENEKECAESVQNSPPGKIARKSSLSITKILVKLKN